MEDINRLPPEDEEPSIPRPKRPVFLMVSRSELEKRAAQVGTLTGQLIARLRDIRRRIQEPGQSGSHPLSQLRATARSKAQARIDDFRRQAKAQAEKWRQAALDRTTEFSRKARTRFEQTRTRANEIAHDHPLHVVLAAGVAGFLLGLFLRARRSSRAG
jgi:ElaB/YqjD/DUF883 family membrane-anchored ribosome-binding protein